MSKLEIFGREVPVGAYVTLRLTRGDDVFGRVDAIDDTCIHLDRNGSSVTFFEELLAGWEIHHQNTTGDTTNRTDPRPQNIDNSEVLPTAVQLSPQDPEVLQQFTQVNASFSVAVERACLESPEPDFLFPETEFPSDSASKVRKEWDRARNQYSYALKVKEISRLNSVVAQILDPLKKSYPGSATINSLLGRVLLKLNRESDAVDHLSAAATLSDVPAYWLALAAAVGENTAMECYALRRYFLLTPPMPADDKWFRYLAVAIEHHDLRNTAHIIRQWHGHAETDPDVRRLLCQSVVYLLARLGVDALAMRAATLVQTAELPLEWEEEFDSTSLSDELIAAEQRFVLPPAPVSAIASPVRHREESNDTPQGRITTFINQRFGFIDASGITYYFNINDVTDEGLRAALLDGSWRTSGPVEFDIRQSHGQKYNRAARILPLQDSASLLERARHLLEIGQPPQAMTLVRRVLGADPTNAAAAQLEQVVKENIRKGLRHGIGLPTGRGPYARAKRAQLVDLDLDKAERLLSQAIRKQDKPESAIKDLASLLHQQVRTDEAIALLEKNAARAEAGNPYDNMLANLYQHAGRHDDAIRVLNRLVRTADRSKKNSLMARIATSYLRWPKYDEAGEVLQRILDNSPNDRTALRLLEVLEDSRRAESSDEADEIISGLGMLTDEGVQLSSLARTAIEQCTYEGVNPARAKSGTTDSHDVARVVELAKELGTKRPRDRAAYYLSAAALLKRNAHEDETGLIYDYLRRYFTSMADASWIDRKPADVVRSYYLESLALVVDPGSEAWRSLIRYLATFSPEMQQEIESKFATGIGRKSFEEALRIIVPRTEENWLIRLVAVGSQSNFSENAIRDAFLKNRDLQIEFGRLLGSADEGPEALRAEWMSRCREHARQHRHRLSVCSALTRYQASVAMMEDLSAEIRKATEETSIDLDRRRLLNLGEIVDAAQAFCRASDFEERERHYWLVTGQAEDFRRTVVDAPTQYSHEGLLPVADHVGSLVEEEYAEMNRTSGAELSLRLLVDKYMPGQHGDLKLQIEISNKPGCSPASSIRIRLGPRDSEYFDADRLEQEVSSALRGGHTTVKQMVVYPKTEAKHDRAFPIKAEAVFRNRLGEEKRTEAHTWTVRLYHDEEFQHLENAYAPFAEGGPVDDPEMFIGRDDLLARLESSLLSGAGRKSIVMFGQKRAGKSSLIEHLRVRLVRRGDVLPVCFSVQELAPEPSMATLLHRILRGTAEALEDLRLDGRDAPAFSPSGIDEMQYHPTVRFHEKMSSVVRAVQQSSLRIVLLIDEFTDVFKEIRKKRIPPEFMKAWKAIIEKGYFSSVLVGQDIMPAFKNEFPNEFGVTEDVRVTYLDDEAATTLVQKPIGEKRFAGRAVPQLLDLTANSPYYTMMFCARLVDYMNNSRSVVVTEADIRAVEEEMLRGDRRLTRDKFDNLLAAGDGVQDSGIDPRDTYAVCAAIARSGREGWCARDSINGGSDSTDLDRLLSDLETRDVVERKGIAYRLRVGLFRDWLMRQG